jgi:hypothetical protein
MPSMSRQLIQWLQQQFSTVPDVRQANNRPDNTVIYQPHRADLVVSTWMGACLYVYLVDDELRVRDIRSILKANSRSGIGSLFMVAAPLLPRHESIVKLADWQDAIAGLHDSFIYAYHVADAQLQVTQVHFNALNRNDEYRVWHFTDFEIENVAVRKRDVQYGIRGRWHVGDIASTAYKRRVKDERANQRFHYHTKYTQEIPGGKAPQPKHELAPCYAMLDVSTSASEAEIKRAFRRKALQFHPDVSALPRDIANKRFVELNEAYEQIKAHHGWT